MANPERVKSIPTFEIDSSNMGVRLEVFNHGTIPQAGLIQGVMNAGACVSFGLNPSWTTEGGVEGVYKRAAIELTNWSDGALGVANEFWESWEYLRPKEEEAVEDVLGYYDVFLTVMFEQPITIEGLYYPPETFLINPNLQTPEAVWRKIMDALAGTGGGRFPKQVKDYLVNAGEASRRYLRGLTDEEIQRFFIDPPLE